MLIADDLLLDYKRCQRRAFLNLYGDRTERDPERDFVSKLRSQGSQHIAAVLADYDYYVPRFARGDWDAGAIATARLMAQGVDCIHHGVLQVNRFHPLPAHLWPSAIANTPPNPQILAVEARLRLQALELRGKPTLLVKQPGKSRWGDWQYIPISVKLGKRPKPEYKLVSALHTYLLAVMQEALPREAHLILRDRDVHSVHLNIWLPRLWEVLAECSEVLLLSREPEIFISRQRCSLCQWYSHCNAIAQSQNHLSLVPGVTPNRYEQLQTLGIQTLETLASTPPQQLKSTLGSDLALNLQQQAWSIVSNQALKKHTKWALPPLPSGEVEFYFDIEAEPDRNLDYLLGVMRVDYRPVPLRGSLRDREQFIPLVAENPAAEADIWQQFLTLMESEPNAPIFHFSEYEVETIQRLGRLYKTPLNRIQALVSRCVDLHHYVTATTILPVQSYSLKSVAQWLGFQWRDAEASGDQTVCWYDSWLKTGDRDSLNAIIRYNEDDCRATYCLKVWLADFLESPIAAVNQ
ncbi:MAG: TM0106 family RecB-like putative nuclease [Spirulinaceae cyanobacterium]